MFGSAAAAVLTTLTGVVAQAQDPAPIAASIVDKAVADSWRRVSPELQARIDQDEAQRLCSVHRNDLPPKVAEALAAVAQGAIVYPANGKLSGDWKKGEAGSLSGYGFRMGDDPKRLAGGNCYACHQLSPREISYGTLGPSLLGYGKLKGNTPEIQKQTYEKIFNAQAALACSNMPRFGQNKVLSPEAIKDYVAFLLDPSSPVNKDP